MTGTYRPNAKQPMFGLVAPWKLTLPTSQAGQGRGIDWTEYGAEAGRPTVDADTTLALVGSGTSDDPTLTAALLRVARPGAPGLGGAGIVYRKEINGSPEASWYGADAATVLTGYQRIGSVKALHPSVVALGDGRVVVVYSRKGVSTVCRTRAVDGTWSSAVTIDTTTLDLSCACMAPDGALLCYSADQVPGGGSNAIRCYRSTDGGATWQRQTYDIGVSLNGWTTFRIRACRVGSSGQVALWMVGTYGGDFTTVQYASTDGGYSFASVATSLIDQIVYDVCEVGAYIGVATIETISGTPRYCWHRLGNAVASVWNATRVVVDPGETADNNGGAALAVHPDGTIHYWLDVVGSQKWNGWKSTDLGATWWASGPAIARIPGGSGVYHQPGYPSGAWARGTLVVCANDVGDGEGASTDPSNLIELRYGGHSQATISGTSAYVGSWIPICSLSACGWTTSDTGIPVRTLDAATGQRVQTALLVTAVNQASAVYSGAASFEFTVRVASGQATASLQTNGASVTVDITPTTINIYDPTGIAPTPVAHGAGSGYVQVVAVIDPSKSKAIVVWRVLAHGFERAWTATTLSGMGASGSNLYQLLIVNPSSDVYWLTANVGLTTAPAILGGFTTSNLDPVPLSASPIPLTSGWSVRAVQGIAVVDGAGWDLRPTSLYRAENMLPTVAPSPSVVWRSKGTSESHTFVLTNTEGDASGTRDGVGLYAVYLDGLVGVGKLTLIDAATTTVDLAIPLAIDTNTGKIKPTTSGSTVGGRWVRANELIGWHVKTSGGTVLRITGNTAGSLTSGAQNETRAILFASGVPALTNDAATLYPSRVLLLRYNAAGTDSLTVTITASDQYTPPSDTPYRQIGVLHAGTVTVLPPPSLGESETLRSAAQYVTSPDGSRLDAQRFQSTRARDYNWTESPHDERQIRGTSTSPDYVRAYSAGAPIAEADGIGTYYRLLGFMERLYALGKPPIVAIDAIPVAGSTGWVVVVGDGALYGRIVGDVRTDRLPSVGVRGASALGRLSAITIEEER